MGINWGSDNEGVIYFDETLGLTYPSASGTQGGGNAVFESYEIIGYPTVIVITPDHQIVNQFINPPTADNITDAVIAAGGMWVDIPESESIITNLGINPNPISDRAYLSLDSKESGSVTYAVYNMMGEQITLKNDRVISSGQNKISLPVDELNNGMYFVKLSINEKTPETIRFIVAK